MLNQINQQSNTQTKKHRNTYIPTHAQAFTTLLSLVSLNFVSLSFPGVMVGWEVAQMFPVCEN